METDGVTLTLAVIVVQDDALDDAVQETLLELDAANDSSAVDSMLLVSLELALIAALADTIDAVALAEMDTLLLTLKERLADAQLETESVGEEEASVDTEVEEDADVHAVGRTVGEGDSDSVTQFEGDTEPLLEGDNDIDAQAVFELERLLERLLDCETRALSVKLRPVLPL